MTEKLYYEDSHLYEFTAVVKEIREGNKENLIVLDKTAFFPEGGGQKADIGKINNTFIYDVCEENGTIYHKTKEKIDFSVGDIVNGKIDSKIRFQRMQSHSGEHMVSGIAHKLYGVENVGFHMDEDDIMTVDFNIPLTAEQIAYVEAKANENIHKNLPVKTYIVNAKDAESIEYRSKKEFKDDVRIIEIKDVDTCACCAPHVNYTGEIGLIKILSCVSHRGGVRLTMICGNAAYLDYKSKYNQTLNISALLCAKHNETDKAVEKLLEQNSKLKYSLNEAKSKFNKYLADTVDAKDIICCDFKDLAMPDLIEITELLKIKCKYCACVFSGTEEKGYSFCLYTEKLNIKTLSNDMKKNLNCRGGGKGSMIQGSIKTNKNNIKQFFNNLEVSLYEDA